MLRKTLTGIDINTLTPIDALIELKKLQELALGGTPR
jgi:DNA mismatch repair protein MutS